MYAKPTTGGSNALAMASFNKWRIGGYFRISQEDRRAGESASITSQRALIKDFIKHKEEFINADISEYVDDGLSGATTARENYTKMMRDIENGTINCIIVKDLSRIGRNMLETDELLMVYLVERNVRFISLGEGYDSFINPLSVLELATINLFNQDYLRDLAEKSTSNRLIKVKRGEHVSGYATYGYVKSKTEKNRLVVDPEAAGHIRLIFSLVIEGKVLREVAEILNAQGIPTPSVYKTTRHKQGKWRTVDPNYHFWTDKIIWPIVNDERYTGKAISKSYAPPGHGMFKSNRRSKEDWIIVPGAQEAIVSEEEYRQARDMMKRHRYGTLADNIFVTKVRCAVCGQVMFRARKYATPMFKCQTKRFTNHYECVAQGILQADIELAVLESLKAYTDVMIDREELALNALRQSKDDKSAVENRIKAEQQAVKLLEESKTKIFTLMVSGEMTQEAFISKKEVINASLEKKKELIESLQARLAELTTGKTASEAALAKLYVFRDLEKLDRDLVDSLINKILVHGDKDIEIIWNDHVE